MTDVMTPGKRRTILYELKRKSEQDQRRTKGQETGRVDFYVGLYLAQVNGHSALSVVEQRFEDGDTSYTVTLLERFAKGTEYSEVIDRAREVYMDRRIQKAFARTLVIEKSQVGLAANELMADRDYARYEIVDQGRPTAGRVSKRDLVSTMQRLFQANRFKIAAGIPDQKAFRQELKTFRASLGASGRDTYSGSVSHARVVSVALGVHHGEWWKRVTWASEGI